MWRQMASVMVALFLASCVAPTATPTPPPTPTPLPAPAPTLTPVPPAPEAAQALRQLAFAYWEAFNAYDTDGALSYLEETYRKEREATIRSEIGRIKLFGVKLGISEESPPQMTGSDEAEMFLRLKEPLGIRRIRMAFKMVQGEWKLTYAQEVK